MPKTTEKTPRTPQDPELAAMGACQRALEKLDDPARARVLAWVVDKYAPSHSITTTFTEPLGTSLLKPSSEMSEAGDVE